MDRENVRSILTGIFREVLGNDDLVISDELSAADVENWDSLTNMLLISRIEKVFSIKFRMKEILRMKNTGEMIEDILSKL